MKTKIYNTDFSSLKTFEIETLKPASFDNLPGIQKLYHSDPQKHIRVSFLYVKLTNVSCQIDLKYFSEFLRQQENLIYVFKINHFSNDLEYSENQIIYEIQRFVLKIENFVIMHRYGFSKNVIKPLGKHLKVIEISQGILNKN